jgi:hypothetical protein
MGKLTQYQESGVQFSGMPQLSTAPIQESLASNERVNNFLSQVGQTFAQKANVYASEQAVKDAITNPITKEQIDQARQTGGNPIDEFLKGGKTYNEAIKKVLGQQVAGELRLELDQSNAEILEMVRMGEITNQGQALQKLQEPISAHVEFLTTIDPTLAEAYGAQATASARNYLNQADTVIRNKEEEKRQFNAKTMLNNIVKDVGNFMRANPNATTNEIDEYIDVVTKVARDTSFSLTRTQEKLSIELDTEISKARNLYVAEALAQKYQGSNLGLVLEQLKSDQSSLAAHYNNMSLEEQKAFEGQLGYELNIVNNKNQAQIKETNALIKEATAPHKMYKRMNPTVVEKIDQKIIPGTDQAVMWEKLKQYDRDLDVINKTPLSNTDPQNPGLIQQVNDLSIKLGNIDDLSQDPALYAEFAWKAQYLANIQDGLQTDEVATIGVRHGMPDQIINFLDDPMAQKDLIEKRKLHLSTYSPLYGLDTDRSQGPILTKKEVATFVAQYKQGDGITRTAMLQNLDDAFGTLSSNAMAQLSAGGLPLTAQLSSFLNDPLKTDVFLSFDDEEEVKRIKDVFSSVPGQTYSTLKSQVRNKLEDFHEIVMHANPMDSSQASAKFEDIVEVLTLYAAEGINNRTLSTGSAVNDATDLINNNYQIESTYYVPRKYGGQDLTAAHVDAIVKKAETIKEEYLGTFKPVALGSSDPNRPQQVLDSAMFSQVKENGEWRVTGDGAGLIYGIVLSTNEFQPIINETGNFLSFKFDDTSAMLPGTTHIMQKLQSKSGFSIGFGLQSKEQIKKAKKKTLQKKIQDEMQGE